MKIDDFIAVPLAKVEPETALPTDVYLRIDEKAVLYKRQGDVMPLDRYHYFISKHVGSLYIQKEHESLFLEWLQRRKKDNIEEQVDVVGEEYEEEIKKKETSKELVYETFASEELTPEIVKSLHKQTNDVVSKVARSQKSAMALVRLIKFDRNLAVHSVNVANLSVFLAMAVGHGHQMILENIYLAGLLHDYGKSRIPSDGNNQVISTHPEIGYKALKSDPTIPKAVLDVVLHHHENHNGSGYPDRLSGDQILTLTKIVSIANFFDKQFSGSNGDVTEEERFNEAYRAIAVDNGGRFDPQIAERCADALQIAFSERLWDL